MKVLIINGSPKGEGSDTLRISRAFVEGMGETAEVLDTMKLDVKPCLGCFGCWFQTPGKCVQHDDMEMVMQRLFESDFVIWSMPLYCYGMPSNVKVIVDRLLPRNSPTQAVDENGVTYHPRREGEEAKEIHMMLVSGSGFPDLDHNFDGLVFQAKRLFGADIPMILCVESPLLNIEEAAPLADKYLALARDAGAAYRREGRIPEELQEKLDAPMFPPEEYRRMSSGE